MKRKRYHILKLDPNLKPFENDLNLRMSNLANLKGRILQDGATLSSFANAHHYYGFHKTHDGWYYREWAPSADGLALFGDFNGWNRQSHKLNRLDNGSWEIFIPGADTIWHQSLVKVEVSAYGRSFDRLPLYIKSVTQDDRCNSNGRIWWPEQPYEWHDGGFKPRKPRLIYECHVGMSSEEPKISSFREFTQNVLPRVKACGYNTIQLMAVIEHPYYASFGYQVTSLYAVSSRFGTPDDLKALVDAAHGMGITVLLDLVHSHASSNTLDGINEFDGTDYQFFHSGGQGDHPAWGTKLFDYAKHDVLHFLLSNLKYWMEEYHFDGFRFDGVTSMLYHHHGLGVDFLSYDRYFSMSTDTDAVTYLQLANELIHELNSQAVTVAEDMSGMPGMALPVKYGGIGFDYRLSMGVPDFWIKTLKTSKDEFWDLGKLWYELTTRRPGEKNIGYSESHDQALVGDKTIMFHLADADMYWHMSESSQSLSIDRAIALHKLIRLVSFSLAGEGYMNFMGNEFGHPEWIDFPREGNNDSYHYARRQWSLADNQSLKYKYLLAFDKAMLALARTGKLLGRDTRLHNIDHNGKLMLYRRGGFHFIFNFHHEWVHNAALPVEEGKAYRLVLDSDAPGFGGFNRHQGQGFVDGQTLRFDIHPRTAVVFKEL
ncbi:MAG: alpha-amylase family glycosyl hydrolase [Oscillospiraceae bacterium]|nr:alpha-amylase family glycosyl hydrolase [Oscillospiraceae bacterium]